MEAESLWIKLLKAKYDTTHKIWKGILSCKDVLAKGMCFAVGDGSNIDFWKDPWVPFLPGFRPTPKRERALDYNLVSNFIVKPDWIWNSEKLRSSFDEESVNHILKIQISPHHCHDRWVWAPTSKGEFSVKSAYLTDQQARFSSSSPCSKEDILPVREVLCRRFPIDDVSCPLCGTYLESTWHLFMESVLMDLLWFSRNKVLFDKSEIVPKDLLL
ncbi:hypothetical protein L1049_015931 [Liquidambar formosana]|uniref:Uncharacterized protein n=1 Tax=Liquidambar formosana TaxID=63359 RepID=A0AAP0S5M0_LIQFO